MVTSVIGKIFLEAYNEKHNKTYTPKSFFVEVYYPLFLGHEKYLITVNNSPFVGNFDDCPKLPAWRDMILGKKPFETEERRKQRFDKFMDKVETCLPDASIAVGYPAQGRSATTSGQLSITPKKIDPDECYLSWIGAGLGVGIGEAGTKNKESELTILFSKPDILLDIAEGWDLYRNYLNTTPRMRGNQINTWNGQWLKKKYSTRDSSSSLDFTDKFSIKDDLVEIQTLPWVDLIAAVSRRFPDPRMMGYVYKMDKMNKTIGFIPFVLSPIRKVHDLYEHHFGTKNSKKAMKLFGTAFGFAMACKEGVIGLKALEPKGLSSLMKKGKIPSYKQEEKLKYETYQIWLLAMLNNEELWSRANEFARALDSFRKGQGKDRTNRDNAIEELLAHPSKQSVVRNVYPILKDAEEERETIMDVIKIIHDMPAENVPYFISLTKIHHVILR